MKVYHGSYVAVPYPELTHSRENVDFVLSKLVFERSVEV